MEDWVTIRNIKVKNPNYGTRKIAEILGVSRNTVKKALKSDEAPEYNRNIKINKELEPFTEFVKESFVKKGLKASRILNDLKSKGYKGSKDALYRYIKSELQPIKSKINKDAFMPYSTKPGEQFQYDWAEYVVQIDNKSVKVYIHQTILGFSRKKFFDCSLTINQGDVFTALEESFIFFGGVCERIQVDNAKVFVDNASKTNLIWNKRFLHFCGFYGIKPTRSIPGHPWSKGKVEKPFNHLETHFITGNEFSSFENFRNRLKRYEEEVNLLVHAATKEIPDITYKNSELSSLNSLPVHPVTGEIKRYVGFKEEFRKVGSDCLVSYKSSRYSVPHYFARSEVWVKVIYGTTLQIFSAKNKLIASHTLSLKKGEVIINKEHYKNYRGDSSDNSIKTSVSRLVKRFKSYTQIHQFISNVKVQKRINPAYHLNKIVNLFEYYSDKDCILAMEEAFSFNVFNANFIKGYITNNTTPKKESVNLFNIDLPSGDVKRDPKEYKL
jgi:transposase